MDRPSCRAASRFALLIPFCFLGCSGSSGSADLGAGVDAAVVDAAPACDPPPDVSRCELEAAWVRGVARFDPSHFAPGAKPVLRLSLRHGFTFFAGEELIGGRLHTYASIPIEDPSTGELPFAIDMCGQDVAMWSEENGPFNLVLFIDENGNNDLDLATTNDEAIAMAKPDPGELSTMVTVTVSCHGTSACLRPVLDCSAGTGCTTITPFKSCAQQTPGCSSDESFCK